MLRQRMASTIKSLAVSLLVLNLALINASSMSGESSDSSSNGTWFGWFGGAGSQTQTEANLQLSSEYPSEMTSDVSRDPVTDDLKLKFQTDNETEPQSGFPSESASNIESMETKANLNGEATASYNHRSYSWWNPWSYFSGSRSSTRQETSEQVSKIVESLPPVSDRKLMIRGLLRNNKFLL